LNHFCEYAEKIGIKIVRKHIFNKKLSAQKSKNLVKNETRI